MIQQYNVQKLIDKIIGDNCEVVPYEGTTVNTTDLSEDIHQHTIDLMRGLITYFASNYILMPGKGYRLKNYEGPAVGNEKVYLSREEIVEKFLNTV